MGSIKRLVPFVVAGFAVLFLPPAVSAEGESAPYAIERSHAFKLRSEHTGQTYAVSVLLPEGYEKTEKDYPVFYTMDGHSDFSLMAGMAGGWDYDVFAPAALVVAVTGGEEGQDLALWRETHYLAADDREMGPALFSAFLKDELIPHIETAYRAAAEDRVLLGSSHAGSFVLYALFHQAALFQRYVCSSPSLWWGDGVAFAYEEEYAAGNADLKAGLALSVGAEEGASMVDPVKRLDAVLRQRAYPGLRLQTDFIPGMRHASVKPVAYTLGVRALYLREGVEVAPEVLRRYVGRYAVELDGGGEFAVDITQDEAGLWYQTQYDGEPWRLYGVTDLRFFSGVRRFEVSFNADGSGKVHSLTMHEEGESWDMQKVD